MTKVLNKNIKRFKKKPYSPLRYPGGKAKLGSWFAELIIYNKLKNVTYIEPYAGGAGAALFLLFNNIVDKIVINDADIAIFGIWHSILNETEEFIDKINKTNIDLKSWETHKYIIENHEKYSLIDIGFSAFFLNRVNVSGILKGGPIGGKKQNGKYKLNARFNKDKLIERVEKIASMKEKIFIHNKDALDFLEYIDKKSYANNFIYLDPPYFKKGSQLYRNHYKPDDHKIISQKVKDLRIPWLITYDNCKEIKDLYKDCNGLEFSLRYSASQKNRAIATELMYYGNVILHKPPSLIH